MPKRKVEDAGVDNGLRDPFIFTTDAVDPKNRRAYWEDCYAKSYLKLQSDILDPASFKARVESRRLMDSVLIKQSLGACQTKRTARVDAAAGAERCLLVIALGDRQVLRHNGSEVELCAGDMTIVDSRKPSESFAPNGAKGFLINAPRLAMAERFPSLDRVAGLRLDGTSPLSIFCREYFANLFAVTPELSDALASRLEAHALDVLGCLLSEAVGASPSGAAYRTILLHRIRSYIDYYLHDRDLSVSDVAAYFRVTPRYVAKLFEAEGQTFTSYVRERRLAECRRLLSMPGNAQIQISELAFSVGFSTQANFNRRFRETYGMSPGDYRNAALADKERAPDK